MTDGVEQWIKLMDNLINRIIVSSWMGDTDVSQDSASKFLCFHWNVQYGK